MHIEVVGQAISKIIDELIQKNARLIAAELQDWPRQLELATIAYYPSVLKVRSGQLKGAIAGFSRRVDKDTFQVGVRNDKDYAMAQEFGLPPHVIVPRFKKALYWPGAAHPVKKVNHPGIKPKFFIKTPVEQRAGELSDELLKKISW